MDFVCNLPPSIDFKSTNKTCATIGTQYEIGFTVNNTEFIPYYSVCYNNKDCSVIYTNHRLWRGFFNKLVEIPPIGGSAITSFSCDINYNALYQLSNQQSNPRINATSAQYLQTGHLFPDRDAAVYSWKLATYSYGNVAPKWKSINSNGNWHKLENMVSEMATHRSIPFNIFDGVLYDPIPENKIYLNQTGAKIEVPQWFYKAVINRNDNPVEGYPIVEEDIIFFVYNGPYNLQTEKFCRRSQCNDYFWVFEYNQMKGKIHCCLYKDLNEGTLPEEVMKAFGTKSTGLYFSKRPGSG